MEQLEKILNSQNQVEALNHLHGESLDFHKCLFQLSNTITSENLQEELIKSEQMLEQFIKNPAYDQQSKINIETKLLLTKIQNSDKQIQIEAIKTLKDKWNIQQPKSNLAIQAFEQTKQVIPTELDCQQTGKRKMVNLLRKMEELQNYKVVDIFYLANIDLKTFDKKLVLFQLSEQPLLITQLPQDVNVFQFFEQEIWNALEKNFSLDKNCKHLANFNESLNNHSITQLENALKEFPQLWNVCQIIILLVDKKFYSSNEMLPQEEIQLCQEVSQWIEEQSELVSNRGKAIINNLKFNLQYRMLQLRIQQGHQLEVDQVLLCFNLQKNLQTFLNENQIQSYVQKVKLGLFRSPHDIDMLYLLKAVFRNQNCQDIEAFLDFYDYKSLHRTFDEVKAELGFPQKYDTLTLKQFTAIQEKQELKFRRENPRQFGLDEEIQFNLQVKNIQKLILKVYIVDQHELYRKKHTLEHIKNIELKGMSPNFNIEKPLGNLQFGQLLPIQISIPEIQGLSGVFIVDIYGGKLSTRVQIKKGSLTFIQKETISGHLFQVYNELGQKSANTGIWLDNRYFKAHENGKILIPYRMKGGPQERNILLSDGVRFEISKFLHLEENYTLQSAFIVNEEQLVMGAEANIVVIPKLFVNSQEASLKLLENIEVTIFSYDEKESVSQKTFSDLQFNQANSLEILYQVPAKLLRLNVQFRAQLKKVGNQDPILLSGQYTTELKDTNKWEFLDFYLRKFQDSCYYISILGRNGETKKDIYASLTLYYSFVQEEETVQVKSDENGIIRLGNLEGIKSINIACQKPHVFSKYFEIRNQ